MKAPLKPENIAEAIYYVVTQPEHVSVNELLIRPTEQERWVSHILMKKDRQEWLILQANL